MRRLAILGALVLSACATPEPEQAGLLTGDAWDIEATRDLTPPEDPYLAALQAGYVEQALVERDEFDWPASALLNRRARLAAGGTRVAPLSPEDYDIDEEAGEGLKAGFAEITAYSQNEGALLRAARQIGEAQAKFDCWVLEAREGAAQLDFGECRDAYQLLIVLVRDLSALPDNMAVVLPEDDGKIGGVELAQGGKAITLDKAFAAAGVGEDFGDLPVTESEIRDAFAGALAAQPKPPKEFLLTFDFNDTRITTQGFEAILQAAEEARSRAAAEVIVTGYADAVGDAAANRAISRSRAQKVRDAIFWELRDAEKVSFAIEAKGERDLVDTSRGQVEANRRVVILVR